MAELLVHHAKVEVNSKDSVHMTALHLACVSGNTAISRMLLDQGADITAKSSELMTPLHTAVYHGNSEVAALILRAGMQETRTALAALDKMKKHRFYLIREDINWSIRLPILPIFFPL